MLRICRPTSAAFAVAALAALVFLSRQPSTSELLATIHGMRLDLGAQLREQSSLLREHGTQLRALGEKVDEHGTQLRALGEKVDEHGAQLRALGEKVDEHGAQLREHGAQLTSLAETAVTPAIGARLEECSRVSVVAALVFSYADPAVFKMQCSAVPLPESVAAQLGSPGASASTFFLTSAHCFVEVDALVYANVTLSYLRVLYPCRLVEAFIAPPQADAAPYVASDCLDLAVLHCPGAVPVAPTRLSSIHYAAHTPAVLIGFAEGLHLDRAMTADTPSAPDVAAATTALHTKVSRLSSSFQAPGQSREAATRGCCAAQGLGADGPLPAAYSPPTWSSSLGFVDTSPWGGMSGGAVMDTHCGLFGIIERRSRLAMGGVFIRLVPEVLQRIAQAITRFTLSVSA